MKRRAFGGGGEAVSEIGLGCWQIGGDWGEVEDGQAMATLEAAADAGVTLFDSADVYGGGRSESLIGKLLRRRRDGLFVATKFGRFPVPGVQGFSEAFVRGATEGSLRRLGVEALDLTQLHCLPMRALRGEVWEWLRALQREGKIRRFGASVESMEEALFCLNVEGLSSLQIIFNMFRQKPIDALFARARTKGVALIVRLPLASGLLSGRYTKETRFAPDDHRSYNRDGAAFNVGETFAGLPFEKGVELAQALAPLAPAGMTLSQMALRFCLDFEAVTAIIPGARSHEQARANAAASALAPLGEALHARLRDFYARQVEPHIRGPY